MAKYRVLVPSFIGNSLVQPGTVVDYDGDAGDNLEAVKKGKASAEQAAPEQAATEQTPTEEAPQEPATPA